MHFASTPHDGSRAGGIGLVIGLHVLFVWALADGLVQKITMPEEHKVIVDVFDDAPAPPPPPKPVIRDVEPPPQVVTTQIPFPELPPDTPPTGPTITARTDVVPSLPDQPQIGGQTQVVDPPVIVPAVKSAAMLCQTMGRPELPATASEGVGSFRVIGTVRDGRVADVQLSVLQALADRKAMRRLAENIERTLKETYHCSSNGQFSQEFVFRLD